jgi:hypothetical protein
MKGRIRNEGMKGRIRNEGRKEGRKTGGQERNGAHTQSRLLKGRRKPL